jgi:hypothetical protein
MMKQRILKIIYWTAIFLLCFWIWTAILGVFVPLEFSDVSYESFYDSIRFYGFPIAIMLTLTGQIKKQDAVIRIVIKVLATIGAAVFSVFIMYVILFAGGMCEWSNKILFINKVNSSAKLWLCCHRHLTFSA